MESAVTETRPTPIVDAQPDPVVGQAPRTFAECKRVAVPMTEVLSRIGSKWTIYVIMSLTVGPKRFSELKRQIEGVSQKMLTATLRDLEEDGFVTRKVTLAREDAFVILHPVPPADHGEARIERGAVERPGRSNDGDRIARTHGLGFAERGEGRHG